MTTTGLTAMQKQFFDDNGYVLVKGVFTPEEAAEFRAEAHALAARLQAAKAHTDATWSSVRNDEPAKKTVILHCHDVQFHAAAFGRMILDPRFTALAQSILGPNVQLHHTKMFIKPPEKGSPFPMHQDEPFFPHDQHSMIAAVVHFDESTIEKGCLRVVPGTHKLGPLTPDNKADNSLAPERYSGEAATPCEAGPGDVLLFSYLTIHGSGVNVSKEARTTVLVQMRDPVDMPTIRTHESRGQGMMLAGVDPNAVARPAWEAPAAKAAGATMGGAMGLAPTMGGR